MNLAERVLEVLSSVKLVAPVRLIEMKKRKEWMVYIPHRYASICGIREGETYTWMESGTLLLLQPDVGGGLKTTRFARKHLALSVPGSFASKAGTRVLLLVVMRDGSLALIPLKTLDPALAGREARAPVVDN